MQTRSLSRVLSDPPNFAVVQCLVWWEYYRPSREKINIKINEENRIVQSVECNAKSVEFGV